MLFEFSGFPCLHLRLLLVVAVSLTGCRNSKRGNPATEKVSTTLLALRTWRIENADESALRESGGGTTEAKPLAESASGPRLDGETKNQLALVDPESSGWESERLNHPASRTLRRQIV